MAHIPLLNKGVNNSLMKQVKNPDQTGDLAAYARLEEARQEIQRQRNQPLSARRFAFEVLNVGTKDNSGQIYQTWKKRGVPRARLIDFGNLLMKYGFSFGWVVKGDGQRLAHDGSSLTDSAEDGPDIVSWYPVLGKVPGGDPMEAIEAARLSQETQQQPTSERCCSPYSFYLRVVGKSMEPDIPDGSLILVDPGLAYRHGDIVVVRNGNNEANVKQLSKDGDLWYLIPRNPDPAYRTYQLTDDSKIVGVVREVVKKFRR